MDKQLMEAISAAAAQAASAAVTATRERDALADDERWNGLIERYGQPIAVAIGVGVAYLFTGANVMVLVIGGVVGYFAGDYLADFFRYLAGIKNPDEVKKAIAVMAVAPATAAAKSSATSPATTSPPPSAT
jgi:ribosomal protein L12E/L44/L45/RPP1/RPP2